MQRELGLIDLRGVFFPRQRPDGGYVITARKEGENPVRVHYDVPVLNAKKGNPLTRLLKKAINSQTPAGKKVRELREKG